jgi:hypothetical protein
MKFEGKFWVLYEDEPIDMERTRVYDLKGGVAYDGRTGEVVGAYKAEGQGVDITYLEEDGDCDLLQFRMSDRSAAFDPQADGFSVRWTSVKFEEYTARLDSSNETEEESWAREDEEGDRFGGLPTWGAALRDGPEIRALHDENQKVAAEAD